MKPEIGIYCLGTKFRRYIKRLAFMPIRGLMGYSYWVIVYSDLYTMAQRWLPNFEEFFYSLGRLIENSERQLHSQTCSEYLIRRLVCRSRRVRTNCIDFAIKAERNLSKYA
jgi:hypothetical protein